MATNQVQFVIAARRQILTERGDIFHLQIDGEDQTAVGGVRVLVLVQKGDRLVGEQLIYLLKNYAKVRYAVRPETKETSNTDRTTLTKISEQKSTKELSYSSDAMIAALKPWNQSGVPLRSAATISPRISLLNGQHFQKAF